jgi:hypothetical protein
VLTINRRGLVNGRESVYLSVAENQDPRLMFSDNQYKLIAQRHSGNRLTPLGRRLIDEVL